MRLIDADELIKYIPAEEMVSKLAITNAPTIAPVKRGRWVKAERDGCLTYSDAYKQCSECGNVTFLAEKMNYCPYCGARMQEGEEDE